MRRLLVWLPLTALLSCTDELAPALTLNGTWLASHVESSTVLTLTQLGTSVTGSGTYWRFINPPSGTLAVTGSYTRPQVTLSFRYDDGRTSQYTAVVEGSGRMAGLEVFSGGGSDSLVFARQ
jgi:hypothetical protein